MAAAPHSPGSSSRVLLLGFSLAVVALVGCQQTVVYRPITASGGTGYESWRESSDVFMVHFVGEPGIPREQVKELALLRAAELVRADGGRVFWVEQESARRRTELIQPNTAPPESPVAADVGVRPLESPATEHLARARQSRNLITSSPVMRINVEEITLRILTRPDSLPRRAPPAPSYDCEQLLRDLPAKYGVAVGPQR